MNTSTKPWQWREGIVDRRQAYFELRYGSADDGNWDDWVPVALVGAPNDRVFPVQFHPVENIGEREESLRSAVTKEIDFYLVEKGESDPWTYAIYHCGTGANIYSRVHWSFFPPTGEVPKMSTVQSATDVLNPGETALCIFTRGDQLVINPDGSGSSGWWPLDPDREVDRVIIYLRASEDRTANEIYAADPDDIEGPNDEEPRRYRVLFANVRLIGETKTNWKEFACTGQHPIRYVTKPPIRG